MEKKLTRGFLFLELTITLALLVTVVVCAAVWLRSMQRLYSNCQEYFFRRETLLNRAERCQGTMVPLTQNIYLVTVTADREELQFLRR